MLAKYALGFGVLAWVVWRHWSPAHSGEGIALSEAFARPVQSGPVFAAALFCTAAMLLQFVRWYVLVRAQAIPFLLRDAIRLGLVGMFFNTFLAGEVGGNVAKAIGLAREQSRRSAAVATVLMDWVVGVVGLFWLPGMLGGILWFGGCAAVREQPALRWIILVGLAVAGGSLVLWVVLVLLPASLGEITRRWLEGLPKVGGPAAEMWAALWDYRRRSGAIGLALLLATASHACYALTFFFAVQMFQESGRPVAMPSLLEHFLIIPAGELIQALFPAPGGAGGAEYGYGKLYVLVGQPEANGVLAALAYRLIVWALSLTGYFLALRLKRPPPSAGCG